jgi:hypothetical protein
MSRDLLHLGAATKVTDPLHVVVTSLPFPSLAACFGQFMLGKKLRGFHQYNINTRSQNLAVVAQ